MPDVFISHGGPDQRFASYLAGRLRGAGLEVFLFSDSAILGARLHDLMRDGVNEARRVVLICSKDALGRSGVENEIEESLAREAAEGGRACLIPIALDGFVFDGWTPANAGLALAIRRRVVGDFRAARPGTKAFERGLGRLLAAIGPRVHVDGWRSTEIHNFDPATGRPSPAFGVSDWPRIRGRICFIRWWDPGGPGYDPVIPYDRPNRVLTVHRVKRSRRLWREYNLVARGNGTEVWKGPSHHWVEAEHDYAAIGCNRPGLVLFRKDVAGFAEGAGVVRILEFFIPTDAIASLKIGGRPKIYMRWTSDAVGTALEGREVPIHVVGFEETDFVLTEIVSDA